MSKKIKYCSIHHYPLNIDGSCHECNRDKEELDHAGDIERLLFDPEDLEE